MCKLGYFLIAIAIAILFVMFTHDVNADDVTVQCFTQEEMDQINSNISEDLYTAYNNGVLDGTSSTYDKVVEILQTQCAREDITTVTFPHDTHGTIVMTCPSAQ